MLLIGIATTAGFAIALLTGVSVLTAVAYAALIAVMSAGIQSLNGRNRK